MGLAASGQSLSTSMVRWAWLAPHRPLPGMVALHSEERGRWPRRRSCVNAITRSGAVCRSLVGCSPSSANAMSDFLWLDWLGDRSGETLNECVGAPIRTKETCAVPFRFIGTNATGRDCACETPILLQCPSLFSTEEAMSACVNSAIRGIFFSITRLCRACS